MIDLPIKRRLEWFGQPAIYLLQWLATIRWTGALVAIMRMPRGCRPAKPYEHNLDPTYILTQMHAYRPCENYSPTFFRSEVLSDPV